ncbi:MAG: tripartite tricarboxylate transporter substrate binding protein [Pseudorhodoplanes sp.]|jgi:tripartite-type tricarboxylate transporter receptor subunit TctC|nr:tripartite tricarboxylate transporter substrate binding protein [Pseudorhodoplanes sp.]
MKVKRFLSSVVLALSCLPGPIFASEKFPVETVKIVVPFPAGGTTDILARHVAQGLSEKLGVSVVVDNRAGASGMIGSEQVARSTPDGSTLLLTATHHVINPSLNKKMPYDTQRDFDPLALVASVPNALVVHPSVPAKTVADLIALAKKEPGKLSFGSAGIGGANHLSGELFKMLANIDVVHVPYKGAAPAMNDLLGGHIPMMFDSLPTVLPAAKDGRLRVLGVTSRTRAESLPDVPTLDEAGVKGFEATAWFGLYMPANVPAPVKAKLEAAMKDVLANPETRKKFDALGVAPGNLTSAEFKAFVNSEIEKWSAVVKKAGIAPK